MPVRLEPASAVDVDPDLVGQHLGSDALAWWIMGERVWSAEQIKPGRRTVSYIPWVQSYGYLAYRMAHVRLLHTGDVSRHFSRTLLTRLLWSQLFLRGRWKLPCRVVQYSYQTHVHRGITMPHVKGHYVRDTGFGRTIAARRVPEWVRSLLPSSFC